MSLFTNKSQVKKIMEETRNRNLPNIKLANRQVDVIRRNLVSVCRFAIKNLIDRACFVNIDDDCEEFVNFCAVMEQVLLHRIKPQKTWYGLADTNFWSYIATSCRRVPNSCIASIGAIENIKSPAAKGRAFIRCALMEKRLSEYISAALKQTKVTRKFYMEGAIMLSDDANMLCGVLLGLNAIDFSFCLKGENTDLLGPLAVDYTPFLKFHQSQESVSHDLEEMRELSNSSLSSSIMSEDVDEMTTMKLKLTNLQQKYRSIVEQKGYLEELLRLRDHQNKQLQSQHQQLLEKLHETEVIGQQEHQQLETVILELQGQLASAKSEHQLLQQRLSLLMLQRQIKAQTRTVHDIQMVEMAGETDSMNRHFVDSLNDQHSVTSSTDMQHHAYLQTDNGSLMSDASGLFPTQDDSHSLIPLAGSLTEVPIHSSDTDPIVDDKQFPMVSLQHESLSDTPTKIESNSSQVVVDKRSEATASVTPTKIESGSSKLVDDKPSGTTPAVKEILTVIKSDSSEAIVDKPGAEVEDEEFDETSSLEKSVEIGDSVMVDIKDSSDVQVRGSVNQYYSITAVDAMDQNVEDDMVGDENVDSDVGSQDHQAESKDTENKEMSVQQAQSAKKNSDSADGLELEQSSEKLEGCNDMVSASSEGQELKKHDTEETSEKTEGLLEHKSKEVSTLEVEVTNKEMEKSSSSEGSEPPQTQRVEESSSSDDKDPWEMVNKESGSGNDRSSDDNIEKIEVSPEVSVSGEPSLVHGDDSESIPNAQVEIVESIPDAHGESIPKQKSDTDH